MESVSSSDLVKFSALVERIYLNPGVTKVKYFDSAESQEGRMPLKKEN